MRSRKTFYKTLRAVGTPVLRAQRLSTRLAHMFNRRPNCLFIASLPKSGSTVLTAYLREVTGYPNFFLGDHYMSDQEISPYRLADSFWFPQIVHQHCSASKATIKAMTQRHIRPVFLHRNIFDICASCHDKLESDRWLNPTMAASDAFLSLPSENRIDYIIELTLPHHIQKYVSWWQAKSNGELPVKFFSYEELLSDKEGSVSDILAHFGIDASNDTVTRAIDTVDQNGSTRFNKGISGRGFEMLTEAQRERIIALTEPYPWVDFTPIGIPHKPVANTPILLQPVSHTSV